jgi:hypothetical protein
MLVHTILLVNLANVCNSNKAAYTLDYYQFKTWPHTITPLRTLHTHDAYAMPAPRLTQGNKRKQHMLLLPGVYTTRYCLPQVSGIYPWRMYICRKLWVCRMYVNNIILLNQLLFKSYVKWFLIRSLELNKSKSDAWLSVLSWDFLFFQRFWHLVWGIRG